MIEVTNDCGPLFAKAFSYNVKSVVPISFNWPANEHDINNADYFTVSTKDDFNRVEVQNRIKIKSNLTYNDLSQLTENFQPRIILIFSRLIENTATESDVNIKPNDDVTTLVYGGNDIRLDYVSRLFPSLKYLYVYQLNARKDASPDSVMKFEELEILSCWYADLTVINSMHAPKLSNIDVYKKIGEETSLRGFPLTKIRIDSDISVQLNDNEINTNSLGILQFFPGESEVRCKIEKRDSFLRLVKRLNPQDVIIPPSVLQQADIVKFHDTMSNQYKADNCSLGIYINDEQIDEFFKTFECFQIFDNKQPLNCVSVRHSTDVKRFLPRHIDSDIARKLNVGDTVKNVVLSNFNIFTDEKNKLWMDVFGPRLNNYIFICSGELLLDDETKWPNLVKNTKNRIFIYTPETDSVYLDINRKPLYVVAGILKKVYSSVKYRNVYIVMRTDNRNDNREFESSLRRELGIDQLNIYKYDVPSKILSYESEFLSVQK